MHSKKRITVVLSLFVLLFVFASTSAYGKFGDFLKDTMGEMLRGGEPTTESEIIQGLKEALRIGTEKAIGVVSQVNGYYDNPKIKIPLPGPVEKVEKLLRVAGYGTQVDTFEMSMNRAAERAAPAAQTIFGEAIGEMTITDAQTILKGSENEATLYFKDKTYGKLEEIFKPMVKSSMSEVGATRAYQSLHEKVQTIPFAGALSVDLDTYVTERSLDGLFLMLAEEEAKIRTDPAARVTDLLKKVFK
jgi:hypothetical protein